MHYSFVTTASTSREGRGIALEMSGALTEVLPLQCGGNAPGLLYNRQKEP